MYANKLQEKFILNAKKKKAEEEKKKAKNVSKTVAPLTNAAKINEQKAKYDVAQANNDYLGKRIANVEANKVRVAAKMPLYSSAVGDKQASLTKAKNITGLNQNVSRQIEQNASKPQTLSANHPLNRVNKTVSPIPQNILGQMFDKNENYVDKAKKGNIGGAALNLVGSTIQAPQSLYLNALNNVSSVTSGKGLQPLNYNMDFTDYENTIARRYGEQTITQKLADKNKTLGAAYNIGMNIATDPLNLLDGAAVLKAKGLNTLGSTQYANDLLKGGKTFTPVTLKNGKKVETIEQLEQLPPVEKAEAMTKLERLAYESNVRKGKITPQSDTLYGNSFRQSVGELPAPQQINIDTNLKRKVLKNSYSDVDKEYEKTIDIVYNYIKDYEGKGVDVGVIPKNNDELMRDGVTRYAATRNDKWYQDFYKENGRTPNKSELRELAKKLVLDDLDNVSGEFHNPDLAEMIVRAEESNTQKTLPRINKDLPVLTKKPYINNMANKEVPRTITRNELSGLTESKTALNQKVTNPLDVERLGERLNFPKKNNAPLNIGTTVVNLERGNKGTIAKDMGNGEYLVMFENKSTGNRALIKMNDKQFASTEQVMNDLDYARELNKTNAQIKSPQRATMDLKAQNNHTEPFSNANEASIPKATETPLNANLNGQKMPDKPMTKKDRDHEERYNNFINDDAFGETHGNTGIGDWVSNIKSKGVGISKDITRNVEAALDGEGLSWFKKNFADNFYESKGQYATNVKAKEDLLYNEVVKKRGIGKGTKESAGVQWIGEGKRMVGTEEKPYTLSDLQEDFSYKMKNGKYAWQNIAETDNIMRGMYDDYVGKMNESLVKIYPNAEQEVAKMQARKAGKNLEEIRQIDKDIDRYITGKRLYPRKDYYHHFQELQDGFFSSLDTVLNSATNIDPKLVGISERTKPKSKFMGALQHRSKDSAYTADALEGMLQYIPQAEYKISIEPNIPNLRNMVKDLQDYSTGNANQLIDYLMKFTNDLAGKTNDLDRIPLKMFGDENGRKILNTLSTVSNRVRANAVVGNVNTVMAQFFNMPNVVGYAKNPLDVAQGMYDASKANLGNEQAKQILDKSDFLRERYLDRSRRQFNTGIMGNTENFLSWTMELGDKAVADGAFMTFYRQGVKKGMPDAEAVKFADNLTRKSVAGRGIGELPLAQKAKVTKLIAPFQVEVQNAYNVLKELGSEKQIVPILEVFATTWLMNNLLEQISGRRIGFDPIDVLLDSYKNEDNQSLSDKAIDTTKRMAGEALSNAPFGSYVGEAATNYLGMSEYNKQELFGESDPTRFGTGNMAIQTLGAPIGQAIRGENIDLLKPTMAVLPRFGGKQIERSIRGLQDMAVLPKEKINVDGASLKKQDFPASYSNSGRLRFAMEPTVGNYLKAPALGVWATDEGKEYIDNKSKPLGDVQTQFVKDANKKGLPAVKGEEILRGFKGVKASEQRESILNLPISAKQKQIVGNYVDRGLKKPRDYSSKDNYTLSLLSDKKKDGYAEYAKPQGVSVADFNSANSQVKEYNTSVTKIATILSSYPDNGEAIALGLGYSKGSVQNAKLFTRQGIEPTYYEKYKQLADTNGDGKIKAKEAHDILKNEDLTPSQKAYLIRILQGTALKLKE